MKIKTKKNNYVKESKYPDCLKCIPISKKSSRKGFYHCKFKKQNIIFDIDCKNCEYRNEINKKFNKYLSKKIIKNE